MAVKITFKGPLANLANIKISKAKRKMLIDSAFDKIEEDFQKRMKNVYALESAGNKWKENEPKYLASRKKKSGIPAPGTRPGVRTGKTKEILTTGKAERRGSTIELGSNMPAYMNYNLYGSEVNNRRNSVRDPFLRILRRNGELRKPTERRWLGYLGDLGISFLMNPKRTRRL